MTYREALTASTEILKRAGVMDPALDAWFLLADSCSLTRSAFYLKEEEELTEEEQRHVEAAVKERAMRVPLQYILGTQEFMGLTFMVNDNVLIPRQDTETLVEQVLKELPEGGRFLDLCTGSGCIAISVKTMAPAAEVTASDVSKTAITVAKENARRLNTVIDWEVSDLFTAVTGTYDLIASNPPYIPTADIETLMPEVRDFEPHLALDGFEDGLHYYRKIVPEAMDYLKDGGALLVEIGCDQAEAVQRIFSEAGYDEIHIVKDLAGNDRVVKGRKHV